MSRDEQGKFQPVTNSDDILQTISENRPVSTHDVADAAGVSRRTALRYLDDLAEKTEIVKIKIDERRAIWLKSD